MTPGETNRHRMCMRARNELWAASMDGEECGRLRDYLQLAGHLIFGPWYRKLGLGRPTVSALGEYSSFLSRMTMKKKSVFVWELSFFRDLSPLGEQAVPLHGIEHRQFVGGDTVLHAVSFTHKASLSPLWSTRPANRVPELASNVAFQSPEKALRTIIKELQGMDSPYPKFTLFEDAKPPGHP